MDAFIGEIRAFANTWRPEGWLLCNGQQVPLMGNEALFSIVGTFYGPSDMRTYFTVPDLRGTALVGAGRNPLGTLNLSPGKRAGEEATTLTNRNLPWHSHGFNGATGTDQTAYKATPESNGTSYLANFGYQTAAGTSTPAPGYVAQSVTPVSLQPETVAPAGGNAQTACVAHDNMSPYLAINYYICATDGDYPPRP